MFEGVLVDLVPYGERFVAQEHRWVNNESFFWASAGNRAIASKASMKRHHEQDAEWRAQRPSHSVTFGIQTKDGAPLGSISTAFVSLHSRQAMLGMSIGEPDYWGGGYGTDALLLMVDYCFDWLDFHRLWLSTMEINARVLRQMEKVGFTLEGRRRAQWFVDGHGWADDVTFGLLRDEWPGRAAVIDRIGLKARA